MTLYDLLCRADIDKVLKSYKEKALKTYNIEMIPRSKQRKFNTSFKKLYENLLSRTPEKNNGKYIVIHTIRSTGPDGHRGSLEYTYCSYREPNSDSDIGFLGVSWNTILGMEILNDLIGVYTLYDIAAHCIFEMTVLGMDEKTVNEKTAEIEATLKETMSVPETLRVVDNLMNMLNDTD